MSNSFFSEQVLCIILVNHYCIQKFRITYHYQLTRELLIKLETTINHSKHLDTLNFQTMVIDSSYAVFQKSRLVCSVLLNIILKTIYIYYIVYCNIQYFTLSHFSYTGNCIKNSFFLSNLLFINYIKRDKTTRPAFVYFSCKGGIILLERNCVTKFKL